MKAPRDQDLADGRLAAAISNLLVQTVREFTGRGPTRARTYIADDLITVVMRDGLTPAELSLVREGHAEIVIHTRKLHQEAMRPTIVAGVERLTGRKVIAFLSDTHVDPDIAIKALVLETAAV